jgi:hypothetical protein
MRRILLAGAATLSFAVTAPAHAVATVNGNSVVFNNVDLSNATANTAVINFNAYADNVPGGDGSGPNGKSLVSGLTGQLTLTLTSIDGNKFNFSYSMYNNSADPITASRISGIGFNVDPNVTGVSADPSSIFEVTGLNANFASLGAEVCFGGGPGTCPQAGGQAGNSVAFGDTKSGSFTLNFASAQTEITLSNFLDRYQSIEGINGVSSAVGLGTPVRGGGLPPPAVPEASTWAMMLIGFGAVGSAIRRRRAHPARLKLV